MKVFILFSDRLDADIKEVRQIPEVKEGKVEICVVADEIDDPPVEKLFEDYRVARVYINEDAEWVELMYEENECAGHRVYVTDSVNVTLEPGDWIFAKRASCTNLELVRRILGDRECDIRFTVG